MCIRDRDSQIVGVCSQKSSPFNNDFLDLKPLCSKHSIPFKYCNDINSEKTSAWIKAKKPDIIFCFGWSTLIKENILSIPPMGVLGYHPTKLPNNRGRHPLIWPVILNLQTSASTFFFMTEDADNGDILSQVDFKISYNDDARTIYDKVTEIALNQVEVFYPQLISNNYSIIKQDHNSSNSWRRRSNDDGIIDFRMSSNAIYNLVRGLSKPYIGAHVNYNGQEIKIWKVREIENIKKNIEPGKVLEVNSNSFIVKTMDNALEILDHDFEFLPNKGDYI